MRRSEFTRMCENPAERNPKTCLMPALLPSVTIGIAGAGAMGAGIAQVAAQAGHAVRLFDTQPDAADKAIANMTRALARLAEKGKLTAADAAAIPARVHSASSLSEFADCGLVIEAVVENLEVKRSLFTELEGIVGPGCILATNTSSLSITAIAAGMRVPPRFVGMHFFNPAPLMALVEVVAGLGTAPEVMATIHATAGAWGKSPVAAQSTPGFIVNRVARPYYGEALRLLHERAADPATIDAVMRDAGGFRMGPFELMDLIGNDVNFAVSNSVYYAFFQDPRFKPSLIQQEMVAAGYLGRKSGRGFFAYGENAAPPAVSAEPARACSGKVVARGSLRLLAPLVERLRGAGIKIETLPAEAWIGTGYLQIGDCVVTLTDGRTATAHAAAISASLHDIRADVLDTLTPREVKVLRMRFGTEMNTDHAPAEAGYANLVKLDLALDYAKATRCAVARADQCGDAAFDKAVGMLQSAGLAVSRLDDAPALAVMRTVVMLANEAADAVHQGVCSAADCDIAMQKGVSYPRGPLAWADALGLDIVVEVLDHLLAYYGEDRYRVSPLLRRKLASGAHFHG
jgi:3-hydroxybutyryl-CoA dehydrogenase